MAESCIILAAGKGTRMQSSRPKVLCELLFKPLINWVIDSGKNAGIRDICVVVGHGKEAVMQALGDACVFAVQGEQKGTGHAIMQCRAFLNAHKDDTVVILSGDTPLIESATISGLCAYHKKTASSATVLTGRMENPFGYGRVVRDGAGSVVGIVEQKDATAQENEIREVNSGIYAFEGKALLEAIDEIDNKNAQGEYYLTDTIKILVQKQKRVSGYLCEDTTQTMGINDRVQLYEATQVAKERVFHKLLLNGVAIYDKASTFISPDTTIGMDTEIYPGTIIKGKCCIGENCVVGPNTQLTDMIIGNCNEVVYSVAANSTIGNHTKVGPFAYIRPNSNIGDHIKVGDFVEVKNSTIGDGTKISHLTYVGDSDFGKNINIGCGTVTVNYDGKKKFRTVVEDGCFVGCNSNLVAPVVVKKNSYIAAGSTITQEVPEGNLAIARARQVNKDGWTKKREEKNQ